MNREGVLNREVDEILCGKYICVTEIHEEEGSVTIQCPSYLH